MGEREVRVLGVLQVRTHNDGATEVVGAVYENGEVLMSSDIDSKTGREDSDFV